MEDQTHFVRRVASYEGDFKSLMHQIFPKFTQLPADKDTLYYEGTLRAVRLKEEYHIKIAFDPQEDYNVFIDVLGPGRDNVGKIAEGIGKELGLEVHLLPFNIQQRIYAQQQFWTPDLLAKLEIPTDPRKMN